MVWELHMPRGCQKTTKKLFSFHCGQRIYVCVYIYIYIYIYIYTYDYIRVCLYMYMCIWLKSFQFKSCFCCSVWCILENIPCAFENKIYPTVVLGWTVRYSWSTMFSLLSFFLCVYLWIFFLPPLQFYWDIIFINTYEFKAYHVLIWYTYILQNEYHHWVGLYLHHLTQLQLFFV